MRRDEVNSSEVLSYIIDHPECNYKEIADDLNVYPFVVSRMIDLLVGSGKIRCIYDCLNTDKQGG